MQGFRFVSLTILTGHWGQLSSNVLAKQNCSLTGSIDVHFFSLFLQFQKAGEITLKHLATHNTGLEFYATFAVLPSRTVAIWGETLGKDSRALHFFRGSPEHWVKLNKTIPVCQGHDTCTKCLLASAKDKLVFGCEKCRSIELFDVESGKSLTTFSDSQFEPCGMCHGESGQMFVCSSWHPSSLHLLNCSTAPFTVERVIHTEVRYKYCMCYIPGHCLVALSDFSNIHAVSVESGRTVWQVKGQLGGEGCNPCGMAYSPVHDALFVADGCRDGILVLNPGDGSLRQVLPFNTHRLRALHLDQDQLILLHDNDDDKVNVSYFSLQWISEVQNDHLFRLVKMFCSQNLWSHLLTELTVSFVHMCVVHVQHASPMLKRFSALYRCWVSLCLEMIIGFWLIKTYIIHRPRCPLNMLLFFLQPLASQTFVPVRQSWISSEYFTGCLCFFMFGKRTFLSWCKLESFWDQNHTTVPNDHRLCHLCWIIWVFCTEVMFFLVLEQLMIKRGWKCFMFDVCFQRTNWTNSQFPCVFSAWSDGVPLSLIKTSRSKHSPSQTYWLKTTFQNNNCVTIHPGKQEGYHLKSARSYAIHLKDFSAISDNFENFHAELANQVMLSYQGGWVTPPPVSSTCPHTHIQTGVITKSMHLYEGLCA